MAKNHSGKRIKKRGPGKPAREKLSSRATVVARKLGSAPSVTTVFVGKKAAKVHKGSGRGTVVVKQVYSPGGPPETKTLYTVDAGSRTFGSDLQYVFERNVARARRENKKKFGVADPAAAED
jgi:hypothetical protein